MEVENVSGIFGKEKRMMEIVMDRHNYLYFTSPHHHNSPLQACAVCLHLYSTQHLHYAVVVCMIAVEHFFIEGRTEESSRTRRGTLSCARKILGSY